MKRILLIALAALLLVPVSRATIGVWVDQGVVVPPVSADHPGQPNVLYEGGAKILSGTVFKMWFGAASGLCYAESTDGIAWTRYSGNPLIANGTGQIFTRLRKVGSTYYLYAGNFTPNIAAYTSTDGISWTLQNATAVVAGTPGQWDNASLYPADFIFSGGTWYLYYTAFSSGTNSYPAGIATSTDGINFVKYSGNPVINDGFISNNLYFTNVGGTYYGWTQVTIPGIPRGAAGTPSDLSRYKATNPLGPWTSLGTATFYRTRVEEGAGAAVGQVADPTVVEANGNVYLYFTVTPNGAGSLAGYQISCAIASGTTIAALVQGYEGVRNVPIPWGSGGIPVNLSTSASDAFQRANANPIGGNWTPLGTVSGFNTAQLLSNAATSSVAGGNGDSWWNALTWPSDQWGQVTVSTCAASFVGVSLRQNQSGVITLYRFYWGSGTTGGSANFNIVKFVNNVFTSLSTAATGVVNVGDKLTASAIGSTLSIFQNGNLLIVTTDSAIPSGGSGFLVVPITAVTNAGLSAWSGGAIQNAPAVTPAGNIIWAF